MSPVQILVYLGGAAAYAAALTLLLASLSRLVGRRLGAVPLVLSALFSARATLRATRSASVTGTALPSCRMKQRSRRLVLNARLWMGMVMMGASVPAIEWTTMDGTSITTSQALAGAVFQATATLDSTLFAFAKSLIDTVNASSDPTSVDITTGWPATFEGA